MRKTGTASLILGILSVVLSLVLGTVAPFVPLCLAVVGLILGAAANRSGRSGAATAGFILSIIGAVISGLFVLMWLYCLGTVSDAVGSALSAFS